VTVTVNPYQPPSTESASVRNAGDATDASGPWRDRHRLVVRIDQPNLPPVCLLSFGTEQLAPVSITTRVLRSGRWPPVIIALAIGFVAAQKFVFGQLTTGIAATATLSALLAVVACSAVVAMHRRVALPVPLARHERERLESTRRTHRLVITGLAMMVVAPIALAAVTGFTQLAPAMLTAASAVTMAFGFGLIVWAGIRPLVHGHREIRIERVRGDHAWLGNVHPELLKSLPAWKATDLRNA
jgi:hypothetical protein